MKKTIYTPEEEQELMTSLWDPNLSEDPEAFVMFVYPWGVEGTPLENQKGPRRWQRKILRKIKQHLQEGRIFDLAKLLRIARSSGRGIGKSALVSWLIHWFLTTRIGSSCIVSANTEAQLRNVTWAELSKWTAMLINEHWWEISGITLNPAKWLCELVQTQLKKGTGYWGATGKLWSEENPDSYAGPHNQDGMMVIFDEASGIPDAIWPVANGYFTEPTKNRFWFAFSQMRRNTGYFFEIFNKKRDLWDNEQIDARTVEGTDLNSYQEIIDEFGPDSDEARVEVYGISPQDDNISFIPISFIEGAVKREIPDDPTAPIVIGADPAGGGADWFVIAIRQGRKILEIRRFKLADSEIGTMEGVGHIIDAINEFNPALTVIDETGMGGPIGDRLREQKYKVKGVLFSWKSRKPKRYGNKRAEMWGEAKKWLQTGSIPDDKRLKTDLGGPQKKPDSKGIMFLESKRDMKSRGLASPDAADALAVTFAFPVATRERSGSRQSGRQVVHSHTAGLSAATTTAWMGH